MQKNYYAIIPANVRYDEQLKANAKLLYGEITGLCNEKGFCWASNQYFAELYKVSKTSISLWIKELIDNGYIEIESEIDIVKQLKAKKMKNLGYGNRECSWCEVKTSVLHEHHHPIPKSMGGVDTVNICPNCHHEFHYHQKAIRLIMTDDKLREILKLRGEFNGTSV